MSKELKKLRDRVGNAGARLARAQLNLEVAQRDLEEAKKAVMEEAKKAVMAFNPSPRFDVRLVANGNNRIEVIKAIRVIGGLGLKEAKDITDFAGWEYDCRALVAKNVDEGRAAEIARMIAVAGGTVKNEPVRT
jgi:ribosomal protein L7/L12